MDFHKLRKNQLHPGADPDKAEDPGILVNFTTVMAQSSHQISLMAPLKTTSSMSHFGLSS